MLDWVENLEPSLAAAVISAAVSAVVAVLTVLLAPVVKYGLDSRLESRKLDLQYRLEQRRALREHIGQHKGRILETASELNDRLANFIRLPDAKAWLRLEGRYPGGIYSTTFAQRMVSHWSTIQQFADSALYIDATVATREDLAFVKFLRLNLDVWTDVSLFDGRTYDRGRSSAHFFQGQLLDMVAPLTAADGTRGTAPGELRRAFRAELERNPDVYKSVFLFLDGLRPETLRYQRLLAARLVLIVTLNAFGYDYQRTSSEDIHGVAVLLEPSIRRNLAEIVGRAHLTKQKDVRALLVILRSASDGRTPRRIGRA
ncbi:hypothetical protein [Nonomuraea jiangxiensis]|uniref:Phage abortive infection protein n=1 Tax=Nonomuraea jiangxiensis TaxID=633440 RepID=A0A1G8JSK4_9ACTN|nr:hypothetical protein [Nonomuraea jiangxiensis]SDI34047.1 hypothetical protein SAMN05421869_105171 [Nonomuraea jiangxiensis]